MANKNTKQASLTKDTIDKLIATCDYLIIPVAGVAAIWGYDISVYCAAGFGALASVLSFVKLFVKD